jgi:hypothetical protein
VVKTPPRGQIAQTYGSSEDEEDPRVSEEEEEEEEEGAYGIGVVRPHLCRGPLSRRALQRPAAAQGRARRRAPPQRAAGTERGVRTPAELAPIPPPPPSSY